MHKIGVVIVTYNRLEKLKQALACFDLQSVFPEYILVVNNASNDGTAEYLDEWKKNESDYKKIIINKQINTGGSGGFYTGLEAATRLNSDWIWVSDDDAFPRENAIEESCKFLDAYSDENNLSAICGMVLNNGEIDRDHRRTIKSNGLRIKTYFANKEDYVNDSFEINAFSYVGTIISKEKINLVGLPCKDYFIWCDDTEHSLRLSKVGKILCVPKVIIDHDTLYEEDSICWKTYYGVRNTCDMYRRHFPFICYLYYCLTYFLETYKYDGIKNKSLKSIIVRKGIMDSIWLKFGIDELYRPGWTPK